MAKPFRWFLLLVLAVGGFCAAASADQIPVGILSYDAISSSADQFDITNLTGSSSLPPGFPITTALTFTVTDLVVDLEGGGTITLPGSDFSVVDAEGDVDCTAAACNLFGDDILSVTLMGDLSPTSGLSGLPAGDTGIEEAFTTTLTPGCGTTLVAGCDAAVIYADGTGGTVGAPEPGTPALLGVGIAGLLFVARKRYRKAEREHLSTSVA